MFNAFVPAGSLEEQWDIPRLQEALHKEFDLKLDIQGWLAEDDSLHEETLRRKVLDTVAEVYQAKEQAVGSPVLRHFEKAIMLQVLDSLWKEHLAAMDYLRQGIHLRGYAQKNPKQEYKREAFEMFEDLLERVKHDVVGVLSRVQVRAEEDVRAVEEQRRSRAPVRYSHPEAGGYPVAAGAMAAMGGGSPPGQPQGAPPPEPERHTPFVREGRKIGRNEPCPCGSGKKYKHCHGRLA